MKWIGQHIWDLTARFRSSVHLDNPQAATSDPDKFLGLDANRKIVYRSGGQVFTDIMPTTLKVLPHHFMSNEDGGLNKSAQFQDTGVIGVRTTADAAELYAFIEIPKGMDATKLTVYGNDTSLAVFVYESDINAGALTDKTPGAGCTVGTECTLETAITADDTNYMAILVRTADHANDIVYGESIEIQTSD